VTAVASAAEPGKYRERMFHSAKEMLGRFAGFGPKANPIGVDFGTDCLKMAQVCIDAKGDPQLIAAASAEVPGHVRHNSAARLAFFTETVRDLLAQGGFRGRQAILALPASSMYIQHLRLAKMDDEMLRKALPWEARGKLPIDPSHALLRHLVAGEVYDGQDQKQEIILMAAARDLVTQLLGAASKARLDVIGMSVEPLATIGCFSHIYRRKEDAQAVNCFVDIGCSSTRAVVAQGRHVLFARAIPVGGEHMNRAVANAMKIRVEDAKLLRIKLCCLNQSLDEHRQRQEVRPAVETPTEEMLGAPEGLRIAKMSRDGEESRQAMAAEAASAGATIERQREQVTVMERREAKEDANEMPAKKPGKNIPPSAEGLEHEQKLAGKLPKDPAEQLRFIESICREPLNQLTDELDLCRRYYETTFPNKPVDRLIFVGGEARQRGLCQHVAREMALTAQVGDPLVRMGRTTNVGLESGMDRRQPQPSWTVAIGLSLGPVTEDEQRE
jgi:type IV pilus assembly protein PilM